MKRKWIMIMLFFIMIVGTLEAAEKTVAEQVNRVTPLNEVTDHLATLGQSERQKSATISQRKEARRVARLRNLLKAREKKRRKQLQTVLEDAKKFNDKDDQTTPVSKGLQSLHPHSG